MSKIAVIGSPSDNFVKSRYSDIKGTVLRNIDRVFKSGDTILSTGIPGVPSYALEYKKDYIKRILFLNALPQHYTDTWDWQDKEKFMEQLDAVQEIRVTKTQGNSNIIAMMKEADYVLDFWTGETAPSQHFESMIIADNLGKLTLNGLNDFSVITSDLRVKGWIPPHLKDSE